MNNFSIVHINCKHTVYINSYCYWLVWPKKQENSISEILLNSGVTSSSFDYLLWCLGNSRIEKCQDRVSDEVLRRNLIHVISIVFWFISTTPTFIFAILQIPCYVCNLDIIIVEKHMIIQYWILINIDFWILPPISFNLEPRWCPNAFIKIILSGNMEIKVLIIFTSEESQMLLQTRWTFHVWNGFSNTTLIW